jgi:hypothetical protein
MLCNINNTNYNIDINYNNEIVLNKNKIIFNKDKIIFNEETDVIIINIVNYNINKQYFENITEIIIYDDIKTIDEEKFKSKTNIYIIGEYITLNTDKKIFYIPVEIEQMLICYDKDTIIDNNFINKCIEYNTKNYVKNIFAKPLLLSIIVGNNTFQYFKKNFEEKNYIEIIKMSLQITNIIDDLDNIYNDNITNSISLNNKIPYDIAKLYNVLITYKIFYKDKLSGVNEYIYDYIPDIYKNMSIKYNDFINNLVDENKLNFILIDKPGNTKILYRNLEDIKDYIKYGFNQYF